MPKKHNRSLVLSGAAMTTARIPRFSIEVGSAVRDDLEAIMLDCGYLDNAPFTWVGVSLRYGLKNEEVPHYQGIDDEDGEIALAIELDTNELRACDREELRAAFELATLKALVHAGKKYDLECAALEDRLRGTS